MISKTIEQLVGNPGASSLDRLFEDKDSTFRVDWREEDSAIIEYCEAVLKTGDLKAVCEDEHLYIRYKGQCSEVPLTGSLDDRHITILALNRALKGDFEVRMAWASNGSDTLAFAPLAIGDWAELEQRHGQEAVDLAFFKLADEPNVFTEPLHDYQPKRRKWWQFWK